MTNTGGDIPEFSVQVVMRKSSKKVMENIPFQIFNRRKDKKLRVLSSSHIPLIQLISTTNGCVKEINISKAARVFKGFSSQKDEQCLKLILKGKTLKLNHSDKNQYNQCAENINMVLQRFHNKITVVSDNNIQSSEENISSNETSSNSSNSAIYSQIITNNQREEMQSETEIRIKNGEDSKSGTYVAIEMKENTTIVNGNFETFIIPSKDRKQVISSDTYKHVFQKDYDVPIFDENMPALTGGNDSWEISKKIRTFRLNNPQILEVMKLREEICNIGGVEVQLSCDLERAFLIKEIDGKFWVSSISRWENIEAKLHVGDRIISVNGQRISNMLQIQQLMMHSNNFSLKIQRLPKAKVFVFDRTVSDAKKAITYKNKSFIFSDNTKLKWKITEINRINTMNIVDLNQVENIQAFVNSNLRYFILIIHPLDFMKSLKE